MIVLKPDSETVQVKAFVSEKELFFYIPVQSPTTFRWTPNVALVSVGH